MLRLPFALEGAMSRFYIRSMFGLKFALLATLLMFTGSLRAHAEDAAAPKLESKVKLKGIGGGLKAPVAKPVAVAKPASVDKPAAVAKPVVANATAKPAVAKPQSATAAAAPASGGGTSGAVTAQPTVQPQQSPGAKHAASSPGKRPKHSKVSHGKVGKKSSAKWRSSGKSKKHHKGAVAHGKPKAAKQLVAPVADVKNSVAKPTLAPPVAEHKEVATPKAAPKGLSAKSPQELAADKKADGAEPALEGDEANGSSIWRILLVFTLFTTATAGTFVYLKRRNAIGSAARSDDGEYTGGGSAASGEEPLAVSNQIGGDSGTAFATSDFGPLGDTTIEPCSFERYVEIQVAQACWAEQGVDLVSHLRTYFAVSMLEWSKISVYWKPRYLVNEELKQRFDQLEEEFKAKYGQAA